MRLRRLLSTTAALLSMCFCSASSATSSLSTYWLVSCRKRGRWGGGWQTRRSQDSREAERTGSIMRKCDGSESEKKNAERGTNTDHCFFLSGRLSVSWALQLCAHGTRQRFKGEETNKQWAKWRLRLQDPTCFIWDFCRWVSHIFGLDERNRRTWYQGVDTQQSYRQKQVVPGIQTWRLCCWTSEVGLGSSTPPLKTHENNAQDPALAT